MRTRKMLSGFGIEAPEGVHIIEPVGFVDFLQADSNVRLALTDSGRVRGSAVRGTPCVTIRENTEWPETVQVGANVLAGFSHKGIVDASEKMLRNTKKLRNPFGDGQTGKTIIEISKKIAVELSI